MAVTIEKMFDFPGPQPNGMQATEEGIWFLDQVSNQALLVSYEGETLKSYRHRLRTRERCCGRRYEPLARINLRPDTHRSRWSGNSKSRPSNWKDPRLLSDSRCPEVRRTRIGMARRQVVDGSAAVSDRLPVRSGKRSRRSAFFPCSRSPSTRYRLGGG